MAWGYYDWRLQTFCGATPSFARAALRIEVHYELGLEAQDGWWRASLLVMEQLTDKYRPLQDWLQCARKLETEDKTPPLQRGLQALLAAIGCPEFPSAWSLHEAMQTRSEYAAESVHSLQTLVAYLGCPYNDFVRNALHLTGIWLSWSHEALREGRLKLSREQLQHWYTGLGELSKLLPAPDLMAMHNRLSQQEIPWEWLGEDSTRIGEGVRQRVVHGAVQEFPVDDPDAWHVPIYTVTGSVGKTTTARLLSQLLKDSGKTLALAASDGAWIGAQRVMQGDCIGGVTARALLQSQAVQAAVFEQGRGGIVKQGVPYARSDVAILLNVQPVHLGLNGIETLEQMADVKAVGLGPARLWVLNHDDEQCRRIATQHPAGATVWFSVSASWLQLRDLSTKVLAALGVERDANGDPQALCLWQTGQAVECWPLEGVAPYHGLLGEKTLEELLAAIAAGYFGPLELSGRSWAERLRTLRLDGDNHAFRTSVHRQGSAVFVLDKAAELASLQVLKEAIESLALREGFTHRIVALCRSAGERPELHLESIKPLYGLMDEFVCFDRPDNYTSKAALPIYKPGSIPILVSDELRRLNAESGAHKPVTMVEGWAQVEVYLRERLAELPGKILVLVNQPSTAASQLNQHILSFATNGLDNQAAPARTGIDAHD